jgi:ATP-binding cassette subfamily B (MDR/TAP) protein 1
MPSARAANKQDGRRTLSSDNHTISTSATDKSEETEKPPWRALFFFTTSSNVPVLVLGILLSIAAGAMSPAQSYVVGKLFNGFMSYATGSLKLHEFVHYEKKYIYYLLAVSAGAWLFNFLEMMVWIAFGELQAKSARDRIFHGLLKKDIAWYDLRKNGIGALLPRIQAQIRELQLATSQPLGLFCNVIAVAILSLVQALYRAWDLALVCIASTPLIMIALMWAGRNVPRNYDEQQKKLTEAQKYSSSALTAIETVKCFNGQAIEREKYMKSVGEAATFYYRVASASAVQAALIVFLSVSVSVQGFYYGGVLIRQGKTSVDDVFTTFLSAVAAFQSLNGLLPLLLVLEKGRIAGSTLRRIMAQMQQGSIVQMADGGLKPDSCFGNINVERLMFSYPSLPQQLALNDVTVFIPGGEMTFLIGKSGSGKSTLGQLLMRFYKPSSGSISVDGVHLDRLDINWLRRNVTLVEQTSTLFNDTVFNNVAFGKKDHIRFSRSEVMQAVEFALLQLMINEMPDGMETVVGYKGGAMSGGQRQRMALARARLRDTPILVLDESTSALDQISRGLMMDAIRQWRIGKTTIVITHDISQILPDDYVYLLEHGTLVQEGYRKHIEKIRDSPFQGFLPPEQRVTASPYDSRKGTAFESIKTRGSSLDSISNRFSTITHDPLEAQLEASENKRASAMFGMFKDGSPPLPGLRTKPFQTPWMRLAVSPPSITTSNPSTQRWSNWWDQKDKAAPVEPASNHRMSLVIEGLLDRTGKSAAESRLSSTGQRRHRKEVLEMQSMTTMEENSQPYTRAEAEPRTDEEAQIVTQKSLKQIVATLWPSLGWSTRTVLIIGCWGATIHAISAPIFSYVLSKLLRTYFMPKNSERKALIYSMIMLGIAVVDSAHSYLHRFCLEYSAQQWVDNIRGRAIERVLDQPRAFFDKEENAVARLTGNLDRNAEEMRNLIGRFAGLAWTAAVMSIVAVVWALAVQWKLTLISLTAAPYILGATKAYAAVSERWEGWSNTAAEDSAVVFEETFTNIKTVRALTLEQHFIDKYTKSTNYALNVGFRRAFFVGFFYGISDSAGNFAVAMVFYVGLVLVKSGTSVGTVVQVFTMLLFAITNLAMILVNIPQIGSTKDAAARLLRLAELPKNSHEHTGDTRILTVGEITFEDLDFSYPSRPEQLILKGINLSIRPGTSTAIVGGSGSGKSTIANLLLNLYSNASGFHHSNGALLLGGRGIEYIDTACLRSLVVPVLQTPTLFSATIAENIAYGLLHNSPSASLSAISSAATQAGIHDFIVSLPQGYSTLVDDGGLGLSGGQAQRIAVARALVRRPAVLILDEATSALDVKSADLVRETIKRLVRDPSQAVTVIIITHSRDMMEIAEHIVVLDQGDIVEEGEFDELIAKNGALTNLLSGGKWTGQRPNTARRLKDDPFMKDVDWRKRRRNRNRC